MMRTRALVTVPRVLVLLTAARCSDSTGAGESDPFELEGTVWSDCGIDPNNPMGPCIKTGLVAGAVVATSLDAVTAASDASGHFDLVTTTRQGCVPYTVTVTAAGHPTYSRTWTSLGRNRGIAFILANGDPSKLSAC
jgi:hypothetical protein